MTKRRNTAPQAAPSDLWALAALEPVVLMLELHGKVLAMLMDRQVQVPQAPPAVPLVVWRGELDGIAPRAGTLTL